MKSGSITTNQRLNSKDANGSESMRVFPSKLRVLPQQVNGSPQYSGQGPFPPLGQGTSWFPRYSSNSLISTY